MIKIEKQKRNLEYCFEESERVKALRVFMTEIYLN